MKRRKMNVSFDRNRNEYKNGFGEMDSEWIIIFMMQEPVVE